jgi:hypothetical protein
LYSILYPVIAEPPLLDGADQKRLTCVGETAVVARFVGGSGAFAAFALLNMDTKMRIEETSSKTRYFND